MNSLLVTGESSVDGVVERDFVLGEVPGVLFTPTSGSAGTPLVLMGHGGGLHKRSPGLVARAHEMVTTNGFTVAAIDSPGHGDRQRDTQDQDRVDAMLAARDAGDAESMGRIITDYNLSLAGRAVPEWQAVLDALSTIRGEVPVGYSGMTLASAIGLPLVLAEPRIHAAIFGGVHVYEALTEAARRITIPVEFLLPWNDPEISRESGLALFDAFASQDKTLHAFPGSHFRVPREQVDTRFFARHLS
jgi:alpha-beta hydrolase superfamily lysophospholipase